MRLVGLSIVCLALLMAAPPREADARKDWPYKTPHAHEVTARLDLAGNRIVAKDRITFRDSAPKSLRVVLPHTLVSVQADVGKKTPVDVLPVMYELGVHEMALPAGTRALTLIYKGKIHDQVKKSEDLSWVVGDNTSGVIDKKGVYLSPASGWIPRIVGQRMSTFAITTVVPSPFLTVTQGSVPTRETAYANPGFEKTDLILPEGVGRERQRGERAYTISRSKPGIPTDGVYLSAGEYVTKSRVVDGVTLTTYFFKPNAENMDLWLDEAEATVKRYAPILGQNPHPKFDIVSNFFQSGYGMPGWTLLGDRVISYVTAKARRMGNKIPPGYLDHEYVHCWFGNGLFVDYQDGNWCEAITTYLANYLAKELESGGAAREHRRGVLEKYAIRVRPENDYPLRKFVSKTEDKDNDIGYGKGSMFFHMLRRQVGDKTFFDTLLSFTQANAGRVVRWKDWFDAYAKAANQDIAAHLGPYLERKGVPTVAISSLDVTKEEGGTFALSLALSATSKAHGTWPLDVPVRVTLPDRTQRTGVVTANDPSGPWTLTGLPAKPARVDVDPDYDVLRAIPTVDLPQCLNLTLEQPGGRVFVENAPGKFARLASKMAANKGFTVVNGKAEITGPSVVLTVDTSGKGLEAGGRAWIGDDVAVMRSSIEDGHPVTRYTALSEAAAARAGYATYYGWETWVVFRAGRPVARGIERGPELATRRKLASLQASGIAADLAYLCDPKREGRRPGTKGHADVVAWLQQRLRTEFGPNAKIGTVATPIDLAEDHGTGEIRIVIGEKTETLKDAFRPFSFTQTQKGTLGLNTGFGDRSLTVFTWRKPDLQAFLRHLEKMPKAGLYAVELVGEARAALAPWLDTPKRLTPESEAHLARPGRSGKPRPRPPLDSWITGRRARGGLPVRLDVDVVAVPTQVAERLRKAERQGAKIEVGIDLRQVMAERRATSIYGWLPQPGRRHYGNVRPRLSPPVVALVAHFDGLGQVNGAFHPGADDNASGIACVLEAIRDIRAERAGRNGAATDQPGVLVVFPDAEEWGLLGSRALATSLKRDFDIRAVINIDSVGRAETNPTYVLGMGLHPKLAKQIGDALGAQGLRPGKNIDHYAYPHGSDHWPFHEAGIPALSIWASDYETMNTPADTLDKVEVAGIEKIAAALRALLKSDFAGLGK